MIHQALSPFVNRPAQSQPASAPESTPVQPVAPNPLAGSLETRLTDEMLLLGDGPDIDKDLPPRMHALREQVSRSRNMNDVLGQYLSPEGAYSKMDADQVRMIQQRERITQAVAPIVREVGSLDDSQYQMWEQAFTRALTSVPRQPEYRLDRPTILQAALAAFAMLQQPEFAADIGTGVFAGNKMASDERYQREMQTYGLDLDERERQMTAARYGMESQSRRDMAMLDDQRQTDFFNIQQQTRADEFNAEQQMRTEEADRTRRHQIAMEELRQSGRLSLAEWKTLMQIAPEGRAAYARSLGIDDPATLDALGAVTPKEAQSMASANLSNVRAEDIEATRDARIAGLLARNELVAAQTEYLKAQRDYRKTVTEWYGKDMASKINDRQYRANQADQRIEIARQRLALTGGVGTLTAKESLRLDRDIAEMQANLNGLLTEQQLLMKQLQETADDEEGMKRKIKLGDAIDANLAQQRVAKGKLQAAQQMRQSVQVEIPRSEIESGGAVGPVRLSGPIGNAGTGTKPTTKKKPGLPPGWKMEGF